MTTTVQREDRDGILVLRLDDGKPNAISTEVARELSGALEDAEKGSRAVVLLGRDGMFSAGFDLGTMGRGPEAAREMVIAGGRLAMQLFDHPKPIVAGCTGHAIAMGAFLLLASDERIGAAGSFKLGMNETAIGMTLPDFGMELARARLSRRHFDRAIVHSVSYGPEEAVEAGLLDRVVAPERVEAEALEAAGRLAALPQPAFRNNKRLAHRPTIDRVRPNIEENVTSLMA